jgi:hypothetical protein
MTRTSTTLRGATCAPRVRTQARGVDSDTALTQAHWCATRLVHHGWKFAYFGRGDVTALTPEGRTVRIGHTGGPAHRDLLTDLCAALLMLGESSARPAAHLEVMLRLRVPIARRPDEIHPWTIPGSTVTASAGVRIGYWISTILSDDYHWQILDFEASGFHALSIDEDRPQRFTAALTPRSSRTPTTSMLLAAHLATLTNAERRTLTGLVTTHQRMSDSGLPGLAGTSR